MSRRIRPLLSGVLAAVLATLVVAPAATLAATAPQLVMSWTPDTIAKGETSTLRLAPFNPDESSDLHTIAFSDTLPAGLTVPNGSWVDSTCGGTVTVTGSNTISYALATLGPTWACPLDFTVTANATGTFVNTTGPITANGSGSNVGSATLNVTSKAPTIAMSFGAATVGLGASTSLSFTITNPNNDSGLSGVGFSDSLPSGLEVATPNGLTGNCGGTVAAVAGGGTVSLAGLSLDTSESCTFSVNVKGTSSGTKVNTTDPITSNEGATGGTATASIVVGTPPIVAISFGAATLAVGGSTSLTFTITNPNLVDGQTGVGVSDTLPAGLVVATPNGLGGDCGGIVTAVAGGNTISIAGLSLDPAGSCAFSANVQATSSGTKVNTTGAITSTQSGTGSSATASISVSGPPNPRPSPPASSTQADLTPGGSYPLPLLLLALGLAFVAAWRCQVRSRKPN